MSLLSRFRAAADRAMDHADHADHNDPIPPRANKRPRAILGALALIAALIAAVYITRASAGPSSKHTITERAWSSYGLSSVTYGVGTDSEQNTAPPGTWEQSWTYTGDTPLASMVAQNSGDIPLNVDPTAPDIVGCAIIVDGTKLVSHTSSGMDAVVTCTLP